MKLRKPKYAWTTCYTAVLVTIILTIQICRVLGVIP